MKSLLQKHPQQKDQQEAPQQQEPKNLSPNLLIPVNTDSILVQARPQIVKFTNYAVFSIGGLFGLLLATNFYFDTSLTQLRTERDALIQEIDRDSAINDKARDITNLINIYTQNKALNQPVHSVFSEIFQNVVNNVEIESISFRRDQKVFTLNAHAKSALQYAYLIGDVLKIEGVKDITIKNVELKPDASRSYDAVFEVNLK